MQKVIMIASIGLRTSHRIYPSRQKNRHFYKTPVKTTENEYIVLKHREPVEVSEVVVVRKLGTKHTYLYEVVED